LVLKIVANVANFVQVYERSVTSPLIRNGAINDVIEGTDREATGNCSFFWGDCNNFGESSKFLEMGLSKIY
jgi:hypothetical protein